MKRLILILILAVVSALTAVSQSGRRISRSGSTPVAPIQPPLNPEPEVPTTTASPATGLFFLPESVLERQIRSLDSNDFRLADFHGKVVVINLWASWCGPCRQEVPEYEKVRKAYADREVEFIGLTTEDPRTASDRVKRFVREVRFGFRLGWADRELARTLMNGRNAIPQTLVLDSTGRVVSHWGGYDPHHSGDRLIQTIEEALAR